jgi:Icc-related predicted phosphoesterase
MKIQYASDLHLEFKTNNDFLEANPLPPIGDYLVLAGDITYFNEEYFKNAFFDRVSKDFKEVFIVPGNHEYYYEFDLGQHEEPFINSIRPNVHFINNMVKSIDGVDFIFTTLWSKLDPYYKYPIVNGMNDFHLINHNGKTLNFAGYNRMYEIAVHFLTDALKKSKGKRRVVVTHHVPTNLCNPSEYVGNSLNSAFVNSLGELIENNKIDYWVYGHHHRNLPTVELGKTKILTNQLGYINFGENKGFDLGACFEI